MKKKKGFTLIELLAIIVILAIIAVITVPIILNIIDNSRKGAAQDSAYGYKDAINKFYVSKLSRDSAYKIPNGTYTVNETNGYLVGTETLEIEVSGQKPNSGAVEIENNNVKKACLKFGDYAVTITDGSVGTAQKASCNGTILGSSNGQDGSGQGSTTPTTVKPVIYASKGDTETKNVSNIAVGDYVKLGDNDGFYVINPNKDGNVVLMSEYNISNTASETGYNAQNNGIMLMSNKTELALADEYRQDTSSSYDQPAFSEEMYWNDCVATSSDSSYSCDTPYRNLYTNEGYGFIYDSNSNLYTPMESYKDYLVNVTGLTLTVRPMSYDEADSISSNSWAHNQSYWLGSEDGGNGGSVWVVDSNGDLGSSYGPYDSYNTYDHGVRPVIEISTSAF